MRKLLLVVAMVGLIAGAIFAGSSSVAADGGCCGECVPGVTCQCDL